MQNSLGLLAGYRPRINHRKSVLSGPFVVAGELCPRRPDDLCREFRVESRMSIVRCIYGA
jgi:hypothetical protein